MITLDSSELMICFSVIIVLAIIFVVLSLILNKSILNKLKRIELNQSYEIDHIGNMEEGSKRMERNIDAINQRTKAHLNNKNQKGGNGRENNKPRAVSSKGTRYGNKKENTRSSSGYVPDYRTNLS